MSDGLYLPLSALTADQVKRFAEHRINRNLRHVKRVQERAERAFVRAINPRTNDERPAIYLHKDGPYPLIVIGAGVERLGAMKELAVRRAERPMFDNTPNGEPRHKRPHPLDALRGAVEVYKRNLTGTRVFHIRQNPLAKET